MISQFDSLNEHIPLEQGLRLNTVHSVRTTLLLNEHIPLEQGLRQPRKIQHTPRQGPQ